MWHTLSVLDEALILPGVSSQSPTRNEPLWAVVDSSVPQLIASKGPETPILPERSEIMAIPRLSVNISPPDGLAWRLETRWRQAIRQTRWPRHRCRAGRRLPASVTTIRAAPWQ